MADNKKKNNTKPRSFDSPLKFENLPIEILPIDQIIPNPTNPRTITDSKFEKLVTSIKEFPQMLTLRPIIIDENNIILGGNMRLKACRAAELTELPIIRITKLTEEQKKEFIIKDNIGYGDWDWELLYEDWDKSDLIEWGLDLDESFFNDDTINNYSKKIKSPIYKCMRETKPGYEELSDDSKSIRLIERIKSSNISDEDKKFLIDASYRHIVFNYENIAEFYAHSDKEVQELMEESALIIIDFKKAIEDGFVYLSDETLKQYSLDYDGE